MELTYAYDIMIISSNHYLRLMLLSFSQCMQLKLYFCWYGAGRRDQKIQIDDRDVTTKKFK